MNRPTSRLFASIGLMKVRSIATVAVVIAALATSSLSAVSPLSSNEVIHDRFTVDFTIPFGPSCADLPAGVTEVSGTAEFFVVTTVRVDRNGVTHMNQNQFASGTATDDDGATYSFNYANHASFDIPPEEFPQEVRMTDHFNLNGKGKANHMHVGFVIVATITETNEFPWDPTVISMRGDVFDCDPI